MGVADVGLIEEFERRFGESRVWLLDAPARLCLMGEHCDYVPWHSTTIITAASDRFRMRAVVSPRGDGVVRLSSTLDGAADAVFSIDDVRVSGEWSAILEDVPSPGWENYAIGAVARATVEHPGLELGFDCLFDSTIPSESGSSSSSALVTLSLMAVMLSNGRSFEAAELVHLAGEAEWYVGTRGGSMDHATQLLAEEDSTLRLEYLPFSAEVGRGLPDGCALATVFTGPADKSTAAREAFNELARVQQDVLPGLLPEEWGLADWEQVAASLPEVVDGLRIRDRFRFVMREKARSAAMLDALDAGDADAVGGLFDASFADTRDLLGTHTEEVQRAATKVRAMDGVKGVKLMGAGFGGLLLAVVDEQACAELHLHHLGKGVHNAGIDDSLPEGVDGLAAVILCGGAGSRMRAEGVTAHKPLLEVDGVPSTVRVCRDLVDCLDFSQLIVVVPPEREDEYAAALGGTPVQIVTQAIPLGTGDAVLCALGELEEGVQHVYVSFGSQTLVRESTIRCSLAHHLSHNLDFTLPTTIRDAPYAPLLRDADGKVIESVETHLDGVEMPEHGETNVGAYWASRQALEVALRSVHADLWDARAGRYDTTSGELGYPNEMVRACLAHGLNVDGIPCADEEEVIGIKTPEHISVIEGWLEWRMRWSGE